MYKMLTCWTDLSLSSTVAMNIYPLLSTITRQQVRRES